MRERYLGRYGVQAALVGLAAIWGGTFVVVADAIKLYPMYGFLAWRFGVAAVAFVVFYPRVFKKLDRPNLLWGLLAGVFSRRATSSRPGDSTARPPRRRRALRSSPVST